MSLVLKGTGFLPGFEAARRLYEKNTITALTIGSVVYNAKTFKSLLELAFENHKLESLSLSELNLSPTDKEDVNEVISKHGKYLKHIQFYKATFGIGPTTRLINALSVFNTLKFLDLSCTSFGNLSMVEFADALLNNHGIQILNMSSCQLHYDNAIELARVVRCSRTLESLRLGGSRLSEKVAHAIVKEAEENTTLTELVLSDTRFDSPGTIFKRLLERNHTLQTLGLACTYLHITEVVGMLEALELYNNTLQVLDISHSYRTESIEIPLLAMLRRNESIRIINIAYGETYSGSPAALLDAIHFNPAIYDIGHYIDLKVRAVFKRNKKTHIMREKTLASMAMRFLRFYNPPSIPKRLKST